MTDPTPPAPIDVDELKELHEALSFGKVGWRGEWYDDETQAVVRRHDGVIVAEHLNLFDAGAIAAIRNAFPLLLSELTTLRERLDAVREWAAGRKREAAVVLDNPEDYHPSVIQIASQDTSTANTIAALLAAPPTEKEG